MIVYKLFPSQEPRWAERDQLDEVPQITCKELSIIGVNLPTNKAPGPDGIPDVMLKHIIGRKPAII